MTNVHVVILGLLCKEPLYGYEIKRIIEEHMGDWTDIKFGSIYFALARLNGEGKVVVEKEVRGGKRPARRVYRITEKGRGEYLDLLRTLWTERKHVLYPLDIAVCFIDSLPKQEILQYIKVQICAYQDALMHLNEHENEERKEARMPRQGLYIFDHSKMHLEAELNWLKKVLADLGGM